MAKGVVHVCLTEHKDRARNWAWVRFGRRHHIALSKTRLSIAEVEHKEAFSLFVSQHDAIAVTQQTVLAVGPRDRFIACFLLAKSLGEAASHLLG